MTRVTVSPGCVIVAGGIVMVRNTVLPDSVLVKVVPGSVVTEPGRVVVITVPGAVETLVDIRVTVVKLPDRLLVVVNVSVNVVSIPSWVEVTVMPGNVTVDGESVRVCVSVKAVVSVSVRLNVSLLERQVRKLDLPDWHYAHCNPKYSQPNFG
jgi:hypothetical protein